MGRSTPDALSPFLHLRPVPDLGKKPHLLDEFTRPQKSDLLQLTQLRLNRKGN